MKVGVLGGGFDPIHRGHLIIAEEARLILGLREVIFVPTGLPWHKPKRALSPAHHRLAMTRLATASNPYFRVSSVDIEREGPTYSVDTVAALRQELGEEAEIYFIVGLDALAELPTWKEPERLLKMCHLVGVSRPGYSDFSLASLEALIPGAAERIILIETPLIGISSTMIRERVAQGKSLRYLVPEAVEEYIYRHQLYLSK